MLLSGITLMVLSGGLPGADSEGYGFKPAPCPSSPNCVSSVDPDDPHYIAPFTLTVDRAEGWSAVREAVSTLPRTQIVGESKHYLHAECRSKVFGFVDDLELGLDRSTGVVLVRSSSRIGYSDLGVNRRRVERLRKQLVDLGVAEDLE